MLATLLVATGLHVLGLDLVVATAIACAGMFVFAFLFNSLVLRHRVGQPLIALLTVTLGVGALIRGVGQLLSGKVSGGILLPIHSEPLAVNDLRIPADSWSLRSLRHPRSRWSPGFSNEAEPAWRCAL
jgi:branched-subunit amino acid ABC-type transport system permease component